MANATAAVRERTAVDRPGAVTMKGKPLTLVGQELHVGEMAPDFTVVANDLSDFNFSDVRGKQVCILSAVPSLDTSVCSLETRRFNVEAAKIPEVAILTISMDLPFAQKRWCAAEGIDKVQTLSDYRQADFGQKYGVLIKELRLLARTVFIVGKDGRIAYIQPVRELTQEPDYDQVLEKATSMKSTSASPGSATP